MHLYTVDGKTVDFDALKLPDGRYAAQLTADNLYNAMKHLPLNIKAGMGRHALLEVLARHVNPSRNVVVVDANTLPRKEPA